MTLQSVLTLRLAFGVWASITVSYGIAWQLSFIAPIFTAIFLLLPGWIGWIMAAQLVRRLIYSLLLGLLISEVLLRVPLVCVPIYGLLLFWIYYNDTPSAPPFSTMFMTIGITIVPMLGLSGVGFSHFISMALLFNFCVGLVGAWLFHLLIPNSLAAQLPEAASKKPEPPPLPGKEERIEQALASTMVALTAVVIFFSFNLMSYAFAMIQICFMVGAPNASSSLAAMKANALACCIGGLAIILVFNLLVAVPTYLFLMAICLLVLLFFASQIYAGGPHAGAFTSGLTTFLVLLGTSTMVGKLASTNFYIRIALILFAGLFAVSGLILANHFITSRKKKRNRASSAITV